MAKESSVRGRGEKRFRWKGENGKVFVATMGEVAEKNGINYSSLHARVDASLEIEPYPHYMQVYAATAKEYVGSRSKRKAAYVLVSGVKCYTAGQARHALKKAFLIDGISEKQIKEFCGGTCGKRLTAKAALAMGGKRIDPSSMAPTKNRGKWGHPPLTPIDPVELAKNPEQMRKLAAALILDSIDEYLAGDADNLKPPRKSGYRHSEDFYPLTSYRFLNGEIGDIKLWTDAADLGIGPKECRKLLSIPKDELRKTVRDLRREIA